MQKKLN